MGGAVIQRSRQYPLLAPPVHSTQIMTHENGMTLCYARTRLLSLIALSLLYKSGTFCCLLNPQTRELISGRKTSHKHNFSVAWNLSPSGRVHAGSLFVSEEQKQVGS